MILSKTMYSVLGMYFDQLYNHPIRTKSILSFALAVSANYTSQCIYGGKRILQQEIIAHAIFGLVFGGSIPHYFFKTMERLIHDDAKFGRVLQILCERIIYTPIYQALFIYMLGRFELHSHETALMDLKSIFWPLLKSNWQYLTIFQLLNAYLIPKMLHPILLSAASFAWIMYISDKRRKHLNETECN